MRRKTIEDLKQELKDNRSLLSIKALGEYRRNGVVVKTAPANTGFVYDRKLILSDGKSIIAWL
ncbi:hypothetical protein ACEE21_14600 [Clostridium baratii]